MHLKNVSLIYDDHGDIHLAPAYDLLSTRLIIPEKTDPEEMALPVNGKKSHLKRRDFVDFAQNSGLNEKQVHNSFERISGALPEMVAFLRKGFLFPEKATEFAKLIHSRSQRLKT